MTFEKILDDLSFNKITPKEAYDEMVSKDKMKIINYYSHISNITNEPLKDGQLQELNAIVNILQILYNSDIDSPISDTDYDSLQELLIDMGIPRLTGSIEINSDSKVKHKYTQLRGTLDKVYYLYSTEKRTNKSRKYLDEWIKSTEALYQKKTGKSIDLNKVKIIIQPKFDGSSAILEKDEKMLWITRGDTRNNLASDVSHIMNIFNDLYSEYPEGTGIKFEVMCTEENKEKINQFYRHHPYRNSRQIVTSTFNSNEPDFKAEYLYPVPLRILNKGDKIESIHPDLIEKFPTKICTFGDRDIIRKFSDENKYVTLNGMRFRTDGAVLTIMDPHIQEVLGRENNINNFEVAYKFTEEYAYTKVKNVEFYLSDFGYITPILVVNDVIIKGNTINHISLSNKERFDELDLHYGDDVKILYDIIPYAIIDNNCKRVPNGRKIEFISHCPKCHEPLDLNHVMIQCKNPNCPSRLIGRVLNYCNNLRIQNIGFATLDILYAVGLLDDGIISLYKLKKKTHLIEDLEGFGRTKTKKIVKEIESKRVLRDADFFGSLGIEGLSIKSFEDIFSKIKLDDFINMIKVKNFDLLYEKLININGIGNLKANKIIIYFKNPKSFSELKKLLKEVRLVESYGADNGFKGRITFTGCRPSDDLSNYLKKNGWKPDNWSDKETKYLVIPKDDFESSKVLKARELNIPIISLNNNDPLEVLQSKIKDLK